MSTVKAMRARLREHNKQFVIKGISSMKKKTLAQKVVQADKAMRAVDRAVRKERRAIAKRHPYVHDTPKAPKKKKADKPKQKKKKKRMVMKVSKPTGKEKAMVGRRATKGQKTFSDAVRRIEEKAKAGMYD